MYKYELTMVNGEKIIMESYIGVEQFVKLVTSFSKSDDFMTSGESIARCKYIVSIKEIK